MVHQQMKTINYPTPKPSYTGPYSSPINSSRGEQPASDSTTAFLLAETLAEQNMSEEQILRAMDSLQRKSMEAQKHGKQGTRHCNTDN